MEVKVTLVLDHTKLTDLAALINVMLTDSSPSPARDESPPARPSRPPAPAPEERDEVSEVEPEPEPAPPPARVKRGRPAAVAAAAVTADEVRDALVKLARKRGNQAPKEVLSELECRTVSELSPEDRVRALKRATEMLSE